MTLTQDDKSVSTLTQDNATAVGTLTQDNKTVSGNLWSSSIYPWSLEYPWLWQGNGLILTSDTR